MLQAIKIKLYPIQDQIIYINKLLGTSRFVYNQCLNYKINQYKEAKKSTSLGETGKFLTSLKSEYQWIKESHSKVLQQSLLNLDKAYKNFFKNGSGFPKFKSKHSNQSCRFPIDAISGVKGNRINIIKALNDIHYKCSRRDEILLNKYQSNIKSGTLSKDKTGNYYFSVLIDLSTKVINKPINNVIGIDLGIKDFIVDSNGNRFPNFHFKKIKSKKLNKLHRSLSRKQNKSNNKNKARIKLARTYNKINHQKEYYLHKIVNQLLGENQTIVMEDLNVKGMIKNHRLAESIQEVSWNRFKQILLYKANWYGRNVIFVDRWFASSKICNHCGHKHDDLKLSDRLWICQNCGTQIDRDHNASLNIRDEGVKILKLGMSLPEVTPTESSSLESRGSRNKMVKSYDLI